MQNLRLLTRPDTRPAAEANVWFADGFRLLKTAPGLWAGASLCIAGIFFAAFFIAARLPPLALLPVIIAHTATRLGLLHCCAQLVAGRPGDIRDFFSAFKLLQEKSLIAYLLFLTGVELLLALVRSHYFPDPPVWLEGEQIRFADRSYLLAMAVFSVVAEAFVILLTWAVLPILAQFPRTPLKQVLTLQFAGLKTNLSALSLFALQITAALGAVLLFISLIAPLSPLLGAVLMILGIFWLWPLSAAWSFSAARHIFMEW